MCQTVCRTDPSNNQLVKDEGAQIFYSIRSQTKPFGIGVNCEIPHNPSLTMRLQWLEHMTLALIPLVEPCALPKHPTTNWWRIRGHKSFTAFDHKPSLLILEQIVKSLTSWSWKWRFLVDILMCLKCARHIRLEHCKIYFSINNYQLNNKSHDFYLYKLSILRG